jgi:predicted amidohydrolase
MDMNDLNVGMIQTGLIWEDARANRDRFDQKLDQLPKDTHIAVLPEMFTTGFSMQPERLAEQNDGPTVNWMKSRAARYDMLLMGSVIIREKSNYFNRMFVVFPDGTFQYFDKRHLFRMGEENKHYTAGNRRMVVSYKGWRILPLICYDLRFPVWSRNRGDYDALVYVANWPQVRRHVWNTLLAARALENQCYVIGVNRIGEDGQGLSYSGDSMVLHPKGHSISQTQPKEESVERVTLSMEELERFRAKFPVGKDADDFEIK